MPQSGKHWVWCSLWWQNYSNHLCDQCFCLASRSLDCILLGLDASMIVLYELGSKWILHLFRMFDSSFSKIFQKMNSSIYMHRKSQLKRAGMLKALEFCVSSSIMFFLRFCVLNATLMVYFCLSLLSWLINEGCISQHLGFLLLELNLLNRMVS